MTDQLHLYDFTYPNSTLNLLIKRDIFEINETRFLEKKLLDSRFSNLSRDEKNSNTNNSKQKMRPPPNLESGPNAGIRANSESITISKLFYCTGFARISDFFNE